MCVALPMCERQKISLELSAGRWGRHLTLFRILPRVDFAFGHVRNIDAHMHYCDFHLLDEKFTPMGKNRKKGGRLERSPLLRGAILWWANLMGSLQWLLIRRLGVAAGKSGLLVIAFIDNFFSYECGIYGGWSEMFANDGLFGRRKLNFFTTISYGGSKIN